MNSHCMTNSGFTSVGYYHIVRIANIKGIQGGSSADNSLLCKLHISQAYPYNAGD